MQFCYYIEQLLIPNHLEGEAKKLKIVKTRDQAQKIHLKITVTVTSFKPNFIPLK